MRNKIGKNPLATLFAKVFGVIIRNMIGLLLILPRYCSFLSRTIVGWLHRFKSDFCRWFSWYGNFYDNKLKLRQLRWWLNAGMFRAMVENLFFYFHIIFSLWNLQQSQVFETCCRACHHHHHNHNGHRCRCECGIITVELTSFGSVFFLLLLSW